MKSVKIIAVLLMASVFLLLSCGDRKMSVAILGFDAEESVMFQNIFPEYCSLAMLDYRTDDFNAYDVVWMHKDDSSCFTQECLDLKNSILKYVEKGGNLLLTMDAVNLLDLWQAGVKDEAEWQILPDNKISHLYSYGRGKILSLVSFFGEADFACADSGLSCLIENSMLLLAGQADSTIALPADSVSMVVSTNFVHHNDAGHVGCRVCEAEYKHVYISHPVSWNDFLICREYCPASDKNVTILSDYLDVSVYEKCGVHEVWVEKTTRAIHDYRVFLDVAGETQVVPLADFVSDVDSDSTFISRRYDINGNSLFETIAVADSLKNVMVIHYEWDELPLRQLIVDYCSNLSLAWPFSNLTSSLYHAWSLELNASVVRDFFKKSVSIVGANVSGRNLENGRYSSFTYADWKIAGVSTDEISVGVSNIYGVKNINNMDVVIAVATDGVDELLYEYAHVLRFPEEVMAVLCGSSVPYALQRY